MCYLNDVVSLPVKETIFSTFIKKGEPFTGRDVYNVLRAGIPTSVTGRDVSSFVRELFNTGDPVFEGWGCMKVGGNAGPLMFFKVLPSTKAAKKAAEILDAMSQAP